MYREIPTGTCVMGAEVLQDSGSHMIDIQKALHDNRIHPHTHSFYEIVYVLSGFTLHSCNGIIRMLSAGDMFFVRPGEVHSYMNPYQTQIYNCLFYPDILEHTLPELRELPGLDLLFTPVSGMESQTAIQETEWNRRILHIEVSRRRDVESALEKIAWEIEQKQEGWQTALQSRLTLFLVMYSRLYLEQQAQNTNESNNYYGYIFKILQYVNENYRREINMAHLSDVTGVSPDYLARRFKAIMHITPAEYVRKFRVSKAMELLCTSEMSIAEIAEKTGFSDISLFSRIFKSAAGLSPMAYRKSIPQEERQEKHPEKTKQTSGNAGSIPDQADTNKLCR